MASLVLLLGALMRFRQSDISTLAMEGITIKAEANSGKNHNPGNHGNADQVPSSQEYLGYFDIGSSSCINIVKNVDNVEDAQNWKIAKSCVWP
ncbi:hypothetical protein I3760_07G119600 [Carya illinoinensis]|nr:hypothetical protein I3760_07G119600 [Carya illinoinensis]